MDSQASKIDCGGASAPHLPSTPENGKNTLADSVGALRGSSGLAFPCIVAEWQKNARETVRISISEYQRRPIIDCRVWYRTKDGELKPSPKGLTLALTHLPELSLGIDKALEIARRAGIVEGGDE